MKCQLVDVFGWSLDQIDRTDIESLIPFVFRYPAWKQKQTAASKTAEKTAYADEVNWL